jgi:hypothetical protein
MLNSRYVVVSEESRWQIVRGGRRYPETYTSKSQAVCSAIAFAQRDGLAGRRAEVMVRHEDGHFITEWVYGEHSRQDKAAPLPAPIE